MNIVSHGVSKMFASRLAPCFTKVYAFNSSKPLPVLGKFKPLVESKCHSADSEFLVVDRKIYLFLDTQLLQTLGYCKSQMRCLWKDMCSKITLVFSVVLER